MSKEAKLKIAMVSSIRPETNYTAYLIEALQKYYSKDCEVLVYTDRDKHNLEVLLENVRLVWDRDWNFLFQILAQALKDKIDVIHFQHEINMFGGPRTAILFPFVVLFSRLFGFNPVVTIHAAVPVREFNVDFLKVFEWPKPKLLTPLVRVVFPTIYFLVGLFSKKIIVHSMGIKSILRNDYKINGDKITVIPHGVPGAVGYNEQEVSASIKAKIYEKRFLLYFGYFHRRKGLEFLVRAFKQVSQKHPDLYLVLGGGTILPNYSKEIGELISILGLSDKVIITGFLNLTDLRYLLDKCEFVVLPAVYSIAASGPLAQVFAHKKAVIVSDLGVYSEEVKSGVNGLLAKVADVKDLERNMLRLLDDQILKDFIVKSITVIHEDRKWENIASKTLRVYEEIK